MRFFSSADRLEIDGIPFITTAPKPGRQEALEYYQGITRQRNINIRLYEKVSDVTKDGELFKVVSSKSAYTAKNVILATGFYDIPNPIQVKERSYLKCSIIIPSLIHTQSKSCSNWSQ